MGVGVAVGVDVAVGVGVYVAVGVLVSVAVAVAVGAWVGKKGKSTGTCLSPHARTLQSIIIHRNKCFFIINIMGESLGLSMGEWRIANGK